jgi:protein-tyrosine-phosphatase
VSGPPDPAPARHPASALQRSIGAVLRHPITRRLKSPVIAARWWWRGRSIANPPLPASPRALLFLCQGNICRSPFAAELARRRLAERGLSGVACVSGGLRASQAPESPRDAVNAAARYGIALDGHRALDVTAAQMASADVIVVMEVRHVDEIRRRFPDAIGRVHLLPLYEPAGRYGPLERVNLRDPFDQGADAFAHCYRRIDAAIDGLVSAIALRTRG